MESNQPEQSPITSEVGNLYKEFKILLLDIYHIFIIFQNLKLQIFSMN